MSDQEYKQTIEQCLREGFAPYRQKGGKGSAVREAARRLNIHENTMSSWVIKQEWLFKNNRLHDLPDWSIGPAVIDEVLQDQRERGDIGWATGLDGLAAMFPENGVPIGTSAGPAWEITSRPDNTFCFGAFGDLHAASKYCRFDVREELHELAASAGAQAILDTGNWIDGEKFFNKHDLEAHGLDNQVRLLAERYPRTELPTLAVAGADHEGWYAKAEGIDVGRYCQSIMREYGHNWSDLGYMEADIILRNANSGATAILRVMHPGGGTGYATSYRPQKIIESFEGGEKPAVVLIGHYHKLDPGNHRNVWYIQTGTAQDQTPFMRQKGLEAHVGGAVISLEQDPRTGAIIEFTPRCRRFFNRAYYFQQGLGNNRWNSAGSITPVPRAVA